MGLDMEIRRAESRILKKGYYSLRVENGAKMSFVMEAMKYILFGKGEESVLRGYNYKSGHYWRPRILYGVSSGFGVERSRAVYLGAIVEAMHCATLALDDLPSQDASEMRRGVPACYVYLRNLAVAKGMYNGDEALKFGASVTDLAAHQLFTVFEDAVSRWAGSSVQKEKISREISRTKVRMIEGQHLDLHFRGGINRLDEFIDFYREKTGSLFGTAATMGGVAGGARNSTVNSLREFGECIGIAYQLSDDLLDRKSVFAKIGKPTGQDARFRNVFDVSSDKQVEEARAYYLKQASYYLSDARGKKRRRKFGSVKRVVASMDERYKQVLNK